MKNICTTRDLAINGAPPLFDSPVHVGRPNIGNRQRFMELMSDLLDRRWLTNNGPLVQEFEARIAARLGVAHCVAMCNGTLALEVAIRACGLGGEVIVPSWSFVATAHALHWQGITPVFADIDPSTHNLDPASVERMITPRTTGIVAVHLWGRAAPIEDLQAIASRHGLKLLFDAAHAFGSTHRGTAIGGFGECEVLSFHATKAFNTMEGGAVVTNNPDLAEAMRLMRNFGFAGYDNVIHPGTNGKMIEACAAMGLANLESIEEVFRINGTNHERYKEAFARAPGIRLLEYPAPERNSKHYVVLELSDSCRCSRDELIQALHAENVLARKYFWPGIHGMSPYRELYPHAKLLLTQTELVADRIVVLPNGTAVTDEEIDAISAVVCLLV